MNTNEYNFSSRIDFSIYSMYKKREAMLLKINFFFENEALREKILFYVFEIFFLRIAHISPFGY